MKVDAAKILRKLPREKAFYFFTSIGNYTGLNAFSLKEFMEKINEVDVKSIEFHLHRGDFEKWINEVLEDAELANEIVKLQHANFTGDSLRKELYALVWRRYKQLGGNS